ncbi:apolipoprotein N-acyltransferase [Trinickia soli]|uniref:Apolipoprotein N-acyltransferase n=1 Tax=Trinickia soli TaxID=380675 RepID=A0A2N7WB60_9BURK|nr:apolipoprotein N-acyltransferase [Trinickia soli]KAA0078986.1 apolipoprotein N-acyltransferase [Paraburkholderia sp. T12-10]PMS26634.1 apolipoprotein N-acyltransferase [Trinickia soli]CAB3694162.1 Apolipoprotein N-acyltransferase [Trinickia soli]
MVESIASRLRGNAAATRAVSAPLSRWHYVAALALGALNTLSFAPTPHGGWLELAIFAALFAWLTRTTGWKSAALTGGAFGFGNLVTGVWWLYVSMHHYGEMAAPLAIAALVLFSLYLALYPAFSAALWSCCAGHAAAAARDDRPFSPTWHGALAFASAWALGEWLRGTVFTGFPWLASGYAQVDGPFAGFAAIGGVYGVGWVLALAAALLVQGADAWRAQRRMSALLPVCVVLAVIAAGLLLTRVAWTQPSQSPLTVRILQGNVKQEMKFDEAGVRAALDEYEQMITAHAADLIVTPETAIPLLPQQFPETFARSLRTFADNTGSSLLIGALGATVTPDGRYTDETNSFFGITPNTRLLYRYDKHHLVPFGEFVPWGFHWFVQLMNIPLGDLARGAPVQQAFTVRGQPIDVDICYEDIFGEEIARTLRKAANPAGVLVNASNLAWFGDTIALDQHLQMARMRTLETGRPLLAATNTGTTAVIDARGHVTHRLPPFTTGQIEAKVQAMTGRTPYITVGNTLVLLGSLALLAFGFAFGTGRGTGGRRQDSGRR